MFGDQARQGLEQALRHGQSEPDTPTATGNVVFFPKYQVIFANGSAFERLSDEQGGILRQAALAAQSKAIAELPSETDLATRWCAEGGAIVLASEEQVAAFEAAAQPVYDAIAQDLTNAELIAGIRELKQTIEPSAGAQACALEVAQEMPTPDPSPWSEGPPPNGVYRVDVTVDDFAKAGVPASVSKNDWAGVYTLTHKDGKSRTDWDGPFFSAKCQATYEVVEDFVRFTYYSDTDECKDEVGDLQWRLDDEGLLYFHVVDIKNAPFKEIKAYFEAKPWQKIADK